jgi:hypothetical protein
MPPMPPGTAPSSTRAFFSFSFGLDCRAHLYHRDAAYELRDALLQLTLVVVRDGFLDLRADLLLDSTALITFQYLLYGHFLPHKENTNEQIRKIIIGIDEAFARNTDSV